MSAPGQWIVSQPNTILFVLIDSTGAEVTGLDDNFTLDIRKAGGAFASGAGVKLEVGGGWYEYTATAGEADTLGPVAIKVTGSGVIQQNLEYKVAVDDVALSTATMQAIADEILKRSTSNVESSGNRNNLLELIQAILQSDTLTGDWIIYRTNGTTVLNTRQLTTDPNALPITSVGA